MEHVLIGQKKKRAARGMQISRAVSVNVRHNKQADKVKATRLLRPVGIWHDQGMKMVLEKKKC